MTKEIPLTRGQVAIVDDTDFDWLSQWKWCAHKNRNIFYAVRHPDNGDRGIIYMHRALLDVPEDAYTHHENGNGCDNRRSNIRIVTPAEHQAIHWAERRSDPDYHESLRKRRALRSEERKQLKEQAKFEREQQELERWARKHSSYFGTRIRRARVSAGLTLAELGSLLGISRQRMHQIELKKRPPAKETVDTLHKVLGLIP